MNEYLKIKIASLAAESGLIRKAEQRIQRRLAKAKAKYEHLKGQHPQPVFFGLRNHRVWDVRREARAASLAYGFLRGRRYEQLENRCWFGPDWSRVEKLILKYGQDDVRDLQQRFAEWKANAPKPMSHTG